MISEVIEANPFAWFCLLLEVKFGKFDIKLIIISYTRMV